MIISNEKTEKISHVVIKVLFSRFENFPEDAMSNRNAPFHEAFLDAFSNKFEGKVIDIPFFISMSSWLHGLNTTLGQTFFEKTAHILSDGEKREFTSKKLGNLNMTSIQKSNVNEIITNLSISKSGPDMKAENDILYKVDKSKFVSALDFSADVFIEDDKEVTAIELKSVKPNSGEMRGEKQKILEGKCALYHKYPNKKVNFLLGFPFDPTSDSSTRHDKERFMNSIINLKKYFEDKEILIGSELWDYLSDTKNTMGSLLKIINSISTTDFMYKYNYLNDVNNMHSSKYHDYLKEWNMFSQLELIEKDEEIKKAIKSNKRLTKVYNHQIFQNGEYNINRFNQLIGIL